MAIPDPWHATLLLLLAFRLVRFVGWDDITEGPRGWVTGIRDEAYKEWADWKRAVEGGGDDAWDAARHLDSKGEGQPFPLSRARWKVATLVRCAWCCGAYVSAAVWGAWLAVPTFTVWLAVPFALSAGVGLVARTLDP